MVIDSIIKWKRWVPPPERRGVAIPKLVILWRVEPVCDLTDGLDYHSIILTNLLLGQAGSAFLTDLLDW